ncbi:HNH endonuclease [Kineococcus sp. SYSU DK001]|uniref:HNH endonuclease n=1 Tax=Kineococcus sp. SYSU DK001 TaxID=3383122 RepID=UPI003D7EDC91
MSGPVSPIEEDLRARIMDRLAQVVSTNGGVVTRDELTAFQFGAGESRKLLDRNAGIWNPKDLAATLSIMSSSDGPYDDKDVDGGLFRYDYRTGSSRGQNTKLRRAMELGLPIILLRKIERGVFVPVFPVYVVQDDAAARQFVIALDESLRFLHDPLNPTLAERKYAERVTKQRLHQPEFRGRVIRAYETRCSVCSLAHGELLDAAHIVDDSHEALGQPAVSNGLSLCTLHHRAYDRLFLGITPDCTVEINQALLEEVDGPMLKHGLQEMHGRVLTLPKRASDRPDRARLAWRHEQFTNAG